MSNPFKAIGKVFKKVAKVIKKIAVPVLAVGAVVLTGGAALGVLPSIGGVLTSVGISGTLASVLGGAISAGAIGAVTGGIASAAGGGSFFSGFKKGFTGGALTGGLLGGIGVISPDGVLADLGIGAKSASQVAATAAGAGPGAVPGAVNGVTTTGGAVTQASTTVGGIGSSLPGPIVFPGATASAGSAGAAAAGLGSKGLLAASLAPQLLQTAGNVLSGYSEGKMLEARLEAEQQAEKDEYDRIAYNYGFRNNYDKGSNVPSSTTQWYNYEPLPLAQQGLLPIQRPTARPYQIVNGQVVQV